MPPARVILDTDILSAFLKGTPVVLARVSAYLCEHSTFTISAITRFEIRRGLCAKKASTQARHFDEFCSRTQVLPVTDEIIVRASEVYADLHQRGELISDADVLIAATALVHSLGVATNNEEHFRRVTALHVENWLR